MNRLITLSGIVVIAVLGHASVAVADQITLFSDNFNSYDTSLPLAGQGGWYLGPTAATSFMLSNSTPLGSSVGVDGLQPTCNCETNVWHHLSRALSPDDVTVVSFDAYAFNNSHNAGIMLADPTGQTRVIEGQFDRYPPSPATPPAWEIVGYDQVAALYGAVDEPVRMEMVVDGPANQFYLRLTYSGGTSESAHLDLGSNLIGNLTDLLIFEDYRSPSGYLGVDIDNVVVTATTPSTTPVPEPSSALLLLSGLAAAAVIRQRHFFAGLAAKSKQF